MYRCTDGIRNTETERDLGISLSELGKRESDTTLDPTVCGWTIF